MKRSNTWRIIAYMTLIGGGIAAVISLLGYAGFVALPFNRTIALIALAVFTTGGISLIYNIYTSRDQAAHIAAQDDVESTTKKPFKSFDDNVQFEISEELDKTEPIKKSYEEDKQK